MESLYIFDFQQSLNYIDWNVIFLVMGMMIVIAVIEETGIFQWLAFFAYRTSGGRMWLLLPILMLISGVASAFLDNVTTMLLMTPISVQIALSLGISPLAFLIPEVMASNVIGVSTLVGTPTNILIGSYGNISFNDFLVNLTPGELLAFLGLLVYSALSCRKEINKAQSSSPVLMEKLAERGKITKPAHLKKAGIVGAGMLVLFVSGERIHLLPAVSALIGATVLMVWIRPDIEEMIDAVDWTTGVFHGAFYRCWWHPGGWLNQFRRRWNRSISGGQPGPDHVSGGLVECNPVHGGSKYPFHRSNATGDRFSNRNGAWGRGESAFLLSLRGCRDGWQRFANWGFSEYGHCRDCGWHWIPYLLCLFPEERHTCTADYS